MDSQHRHELQENALAHWLEQKIEEVKPHLPLILVGVVAAAVGAWGVGTYRSSTAEADARAWDGYAIAMETGRPNLTVLEKLSEEQEGPAADWADAIWADGQLYVAAQSYLRSREAATEALEQAREKYQALRGASDPRIRNRAVLGLARAAELEGDLEAARDLYGKVGGAFAELARERAEELADPAVIDDYAWLKEANLTRARAAAGPGVPGQTPDFAVDLIDTPDAGSQAPQQTGEEALSDILQGIEAEIEATETEATEAESAEPGSAETEAPAADAAEEAAQPADDAPPASEQDAGDAAP